MLILLSPAKSLDYESKLPSKRATEPRMLEEAEALIEVMRQKSVEDVAELMSISLELAERNVRRYADFHVPFTKENARPAVFAFDGDVYHGMGARTSFDERDLTEAQKSVRILSGLYGVLRPLDLMQPYRLEMGTKLATDRGDTLYDFWGSRITDLLNADLAESPGPDVVVNLASGEYFRSVEPKQLDGTLISPRFLDQAPGGDYRIISFSAKWARGAMVAWMVRNRVRSIRSLKDFDVAGYRYDPARSTPTEPTFFRPPGGPARQTGSRCWWVTSRADGVTDLVGSDRIGGVENVRVDAWLWAIRLCTTRTEATAACRGGHVRINGAPAKPAATVKVGDRVTAYVHERHRDVEVVQPLAKRVGAPIAAQAYVDHSPPPPPRDDLPTIFRSPASGRPTKKERRETDRLRRR